MFLIYGFNEVWNKIATTYLKFGDESMSDIQFRNIAKGILPRLSYTFRKM